MSKFFTKTKEAFSFVTTRPLRIGSKAPDFTAKSTGDDGQTLVGDDFHFHSYIDSRWAVLFSHPCDFTPVCTTEIAAFAEMQDEFAKRDTKLIGLAVARLHSHKKWIWHIHSNVVTSNRIKFPIVADEKADIAKMYDMLDREEHPTNEEITECSAKLHTIRSVFIIDPDKRIRAILSYPMETGRSIIEIIRVIDSLQARAEHGPNIVTPANWQPGDPVLFRQDDGMVLSRSQADVIMKFNLPYMKFRALPREQIRGYRQDSLQVPFSELTPTDFSIEDSINRSNSSRRDSPKAPFLKSTPTGLSMEDSITTSTSSIQGTTIDRLVIALIQDTVLQALYSDALRKKRFVENLRRLLIQYSEDLESKALNKSDKQAAWFLQKEAHVLATRISILYETKTDETRVAMRRLARQHSDKSLQFETWMQIYANENSGEKIRAPKDTDNGGSNNDRSSSDKEDRETALLKQFEVFLTQGESYGISKKKLDDFVHPEPIQDLKRSQVEEPQTIEFASSLEAGTGSQFSKKLRFWCSSVWSIYANSVANELGTSSFSKFLRRWSDLYTPEGYTRINFDCACGMENFAIIKRLPSDMIIDLKQELAQETSSSPLSIRLESHEPPLSAGSVQTGDTTSITQLITDSKASPPENSIRKRTDFGDNDNRNNRQFIMLCANLSPHDARLTQIEVTKTENDHQLMRQIRQAYFTLRKCHNTKFSLLHPTTIQLVKFEVVPHDPPLTPQPVGIHQPPSIPSPIEAEAENYHYSPCPAHHTPPIPPQIFIHAFFNPSQSHTSKYLLTRLPKKRGQQLIYPSAPTVTNFGWGIYIIDGPNWFTLSCVFLSILVITGVFSLLWSVVKGDISGGFAIGAYLVAVATAVLTVLFYAWTSPAVNK